MEQAQPSLDPVQQSLRASDQELYLASNCIGMLPSLCAEGAFGEQEMKLQSPCAGTRMN